MTGSMDGNPNRRCAHGRLFTESCEGCGYIHPRDLTFRIESSNGVTSGPYATRSAAQAAAESANSIAPEQGWHAVPESEYPR